MPPKPFPKPPRPPRSVKYRRSKLPKIPKTIDIDLSSINSVFEDLDSMFEDFDDMIEDLENFDIKEIKIKMSHTIFICVPNDKEKIEKIFAKIGTLGVKISPAADDSSLYAPTESLSTLMAIKVDNFNTKIPRGKLLDRITSAIENIQFYGICILQDGGGSTWRAGNVPKKKPKEQTVKVEPKTPKPEPEPKIQDKFNDFKMKELLLKVIGKSTEISDVFFDGIPRDDRVLLSSKLNELFSEQDK